MSFTNPYFLLFIAIFLLVYAILPVQVRRWWLLVSGVVYCAFAGWIALAFALGYAVMNYILGETISRAKKQKRKQTLRGGLALDVFLLAAMKLLARFNLFAFPTGMSFYSFSAMAYLIDVSNRKVKAAGSLMDFLNFSLYFPKFLQGPIVRYDQICKELPAGKKMRAGNLQAGLEKFVLGFCMKVLVADRLGGLWTMYGGMMTNGFENLHPAMAWLGAISYSVQLYVDWQSYMLMAIGMARMMGITLPPNFDVPYAAKTVGDYFRRWHMTLTSWFKDYIYIPLGGNRKGMPRTILNILIVWLVTSLWHGLSWNFLIWGLSIGLMIVLEKLCFGKLLNQVPVLGHAVVLFIIPLTWVCFNSMIPSVSALGVYFGRLFPFLSSVEPYLSDTVMWNYFVSAFGRYWPYLFAGILFCTPYPERVVERYGRSWEVSILLSALFWWAVILCIQNGGSLAMYANF